MLKQIFSHSRSRQIVSNRADVVNKFQFGNIWIIGFSITGYGDEASYGKLLEEKLRLEGWSGKVTDVSFGGLSVNALAGLIQNAAKEIKSGDLVLLELATSFFSLHNHTQEEAKKFISYITEYLVSLTGVQVAFLNLYRHDLNDNDCVVEAIKYISEIGACPVIDLKETFRREIEKYGAEDKIHPDRATREVIAKHVFNYLDSIDYIRNKNIELTHTYEFRSIIPSAKDKEVFVYESRGKSIESIVLPESERMEVVFEERVFVSGIVFLYGPETGYISAVFDNVKKKSFITYDEHSYYRRIGFRPINRFLSRIRIATTKKRRDIELLKDTHLNVEGRKEYVCGFILEKSLVRGVG